MGVDVVGLGEWTKVSIGWDPCGMYKDGALPEIEFAGL